jgi:hypothetical protein
VLPSPVVKEIKAALPNRVLETFLLPIVIPFIKEVLETSKEPKITAEPVKGKTLANDAVVAKEEEIAVEAEVANEALTAFKTYEAV